jgi:hypothetical protein
VSAGAGSGSASARWHHPVCQSGWSSTGRCWLLVPSRLQIPTFAVGGAFHRQAVYFQSRHSKSLHYSLNCLRPSQLSLTSAVSMRGGGCWGSSRFSFSVTGADPDWVGSNGAAPAWRAFQFVDVQLPKPDEAVTRQTFGFRLATLVFLRAHAQASRAFTSIPVSFLRIRLLSKRTGRELNSYWFSWLISAESDFESGCCICLPPNPWLEAAIAILTLLTRLSQLEGYLSAKWFIFSHGVPKVFTTVLTVSGPASFL